MKEEKVYLNMKQIESVIGGEYYTGLPDLPEILPGQTYCSNCKKGVYHTTNSNGESCCPDCGQVFISANYA